MIKLKKFIANDPFQTGVKLNNLKVIDQMWVNLHKPKIKDQNEKGVKIQG
jgi:hypothetical protein